ncbi:MAG: class I SAM-dependent methyltransferase [Solirubrobacteraceae bacterium]
MAKVRRGPDQRGPWWTEILAAIAQSYADCCYMEIGVEHGTSVNVVAPCCGEVHGCDVVDRTRVMPAGTRFWHMPSDEFFAAYDGSAPNLVFIDGGHSYEQARRDYDSAVRILAPGGTIALHDTWPESEADKAPDRCGDVWRVRDEITASKVTFATSPGLTVVRPGD